MGFRPIIVQVELQKQLKTFYVRKQHFVFKTFVQNFDFGGNNILTTPFLYTSAYMNSNRYT